MLLLARKISEEERAFNPEGLRAAITQWWKNPRFHDQRAISSANIASCYASKSFILHDLETMPKTESSFDMSFS